MNDLYSNQIYPAFSSMPVSPYRPMIGLSDAFAEERLSFADARKLQSLYPRIAQEIQKHVEDTCDQMEYEGSMMFDEYPDRIMVWKLAEDILMRVDDTDVGEEEPQEEEAEELMQQEAFGRGQGRPGCRNCHSDRGRLRDFIQVMLLDEMHRRRCRHRRCRRFW